MTLNGAIMQLVELRESSMMPEALKPCFDKVIETISECEEPSAQPETHDKRTKTHSCDCISRQAAIEKINERQRKLIYCFGFENDAVKIMDIAKSIITSIPPAQPDIIRCKDCKYMTEHYDTDGNAPYWTCSEWDSGTDYDGFCHYAERRTNGN